MNNVGTGCFSPHYNTYPFRPSHQQIKRPNQYIIRRIAQLRKIEFIHSID